MYRVMVGLALGLFVFAGGCSGDDRAPLREAREDNGQVVPLDAERVRAGMPIRASSFTYVSRGRRDPFVPLVARGGPSPSALPGFTVQALLYDKARPMAIINDAVVTIGDEVGGARVVEIGKSDVVVEYGGERITLRP